MNRYTVNSCTQADGRVVHSVKRNQFDLIADICDAQDAAYVANMLNDPIGAALAYCNDQTGEFWQRLAGSLRKAQTM